MPRPFVHRSLLLCLLCTVACAEPPSKEMNQAQGAIDAARAAGADQYAATELAGAVDALKKSDDAAAQRDYRLALNHAIDSRERAQNAAKSAGLARAQARGDAERLVAEVNTLLTQARARLTSEPAAQLPRRMLDEQRTALDTVDRHLQEARTAISGENYPAAIKATTGLAAQIQAVLRVFDETAAPPAPRKRR